MSGALVAQAINESIGTPGFQGLDAILKEYLGLIAEQAGTARVPISRTINGHSLASDVNLTNNDVGAAPDGFGLGKTEGHFCKDANEATIVGFYYLSGYGCLNIPDNFIYGVMSVERRGDYIYQTAKSANGFTECQVITRYSRDTGKTWSEWEWVNPPLQVGLEYRTTERWNGKPVYAKLFDCGVCGEGVTHIAIGFPSTHKIVRYSAGAATTFFFASDTTYTTPGNGTHDVWVSVSTQIICVIKKSSATEHIYCTVHYAKD